MTAGRGQLDHVRAPIQFLDALGIERAAFVGNSMGGQAALRLATEHPGRISHLVTMGPPVGRMPTLFGAGGGPSEGLKVLIETYRDASPENMRRLVEIMVYDRARFATPELCRARSDAALARPHHLRNHVDGLPKGAPLPRWVKPELLPAIQAPTLLIHGRDDRVVSFETSLYLLANIPDSRLVVLNRCGHWAMIEHADEFNRLVTDFIANTRPVEAIGPGGSGGVGTPGPPAESPATGDDSLTPTAHADAVCPASSWPGPRAVEAAAGRPGQRRRSCGP
ncbi:alpha/beta fold hydrolase [Nonomuraea gerenzanensis]|uniref:2-hydroxy-6-oxo-6-phenylhexa-2,4-dienoate hydrolase n=1 Tax=Nonomuraea gerenzanensis TaxID=93944 RepID=A0A1M4EQK6_9ACTN|nr:alpha/beta hydrolase [Nonomuraea gerenzanensis]UBU12580.1 alpha/beta fold hydrolase [Nonomuraea gerenzanensis]SBP01131.1 2-hydroxy-6-oxo-6-phenylhexa-2,4-dienoate hydrolase [Nonomuraea gerenzanensis]